MGRRTLQLALIVALGVALELAITRPWQGSRPGEKGALLVHVEESAPSHAKGSAAPTRSAASDTPADASFSAPPRPFNLPKMSAPTTVAAARTKAPPAKRPATLPTLLVPKDWLLRGSGPQNYDVHIDRDDVFTGQSSVLFASYDKDVAYTQFGSLMQAVVGEPWAGKRVEFSASAKAHNGGEELAVWIRAVDAASVVIAYDQSESRYAKPEWKKIVAVIDVPWSAAELAYGVNLSGPGKAHIDDVRLKVIDKSLPAPTRNMPWQLGVVAQAADAKGPLAMPANLDFEEAVPANDAFREVPQDKVGRTRF